MNNSRIPMIFTLLFIPALIVVFSLVWEKEEVVITPPPSVTVSVETREKEKISFVKDVLTEWNEALGYQCFSYVKNSGEVRVFIGKTSMLEDNDLGRFKGYIQNEGDIYIKENLKVGEFKATLHHELGHWAGLKHTYTNTRSIMYAVINADKRPRPTEGDFIDIKIKLGLIRNK